MCAFLCFSVFEFYECHYLYNVRAHMHTHTPHKSSCIGKQSIPQLQPTVWEYEPNISSSGFSRELGNPVFSLKLFIANI